MWDVLAGPFLAAGGLLVAGGLPKLRDPLPLVRALRSARVPAGCAVRARAGRRRGGARRRRRGRSRPGHRRAAWPGPTCSSPRSSRWPGTAAASWRRCGCFGRPDTPATGAHLVLTAALAATAAAVALSPPATGWTGQAPAPTALLLGFAVLLAALAYLVLAVLPATTVAAVRGRPKG